MLAGRRSRLNPLKSGDSGQSWLDGVSSRRGYLHLRLDVGDALRFGDEGAECNVSLSSSPRAVDWDQLSKGGADVPEPG